VPMREDFGHEFGGEPQGDDRLAKCGLPLPRLTLNLPTSYANPADCRNELTGDIRARITWRIIWRIIGGSLEDQLGVWLDPSPPFGWTPRGFISTPRGFG